MDEDQPDLRVDQALGDYDSLSITPLQEDSEIVMRDALPWRMNLCATSKRDPCTFFVAIYSEVDVYILDTPETSFRSPAKRLSNPHNRTNVGDDHTPYSINAIKVDYILDKEVLVTVTDGGHVCVWQTDALEKPPLVLENHSSTWGISIHPEQGLVAVSANNWRVTIFNMVAITRDNPIFGKRKRPNVLKDNARVQLVGHDNNIPCIDFHSSGRYIASCSIDQTCRIWDVKHQREIARRRISTSELELQAWCWSVKFVNQEAFKHATLEAQSIKERLQRRLAQGRSTTLSMLHLRHSARPPIYRMTREELENGVLDTWVPGDLVRPLRPTDDVMPELFQDGWDDGEDEDDDELDHQMLVEESDWESRLNAFLGWRFAGEEAGDRSPDERERAQELGQEYAGDEEGQDDAQDIYSGPRDADSAGTAGEDGWGERDVAEIQWAQLGDASTHRAGWNDFEAEERRWGGNESPRSQDEEHSHDDDGLEDAWMEPVAGVIQVDYFPDEYDADMEHENHQLSEHHYDEDDLYGDQDHSDGSYHPSSSGASDEDATAQEAIAPEINGWEDSVDDPVPADDETPDERVPLETANNQWVQSEALLNATEMMDHDEIDRMIQRIRRLPHSSEDTDENHQQEQQVHLISRRMKRSNIRGQDTASSSSSSENEDDEPSPKNKIPSVMQSSTVQLIQPHRRQRKQRRPQLRDVHVALTTPKHLYLLKRNKAKLETLRVERNIVSNVDVRSDRMLTMLDRLNMTEYIPELELLVVASQKGTVALTRLLRVELDDGQQTCLFNNEVYLPVSGLQRHALYGMTVRKVESDHSCSGVYEIFLFYYHGVVLGYRLSREDDVLNVDPLNNL